MDSRSCLATESNSQSWADLEVLRQLGTTCWLAPVASPCRWQRTLVSVALFVPSYYTVRLTCNPCPDTGIKSHRVVKKEFKESDERFGFIQDR